MADDTTGWSEKGKRKSSGDDGSTTPSRPSKREPKPAKSDGESSIVRTPSSDTGARKVAKAAATAGQRDVSFASRLGFPALVGLICLLGLGAVFFARTTREALATPIAGLDHWHAVYGVYNCNLEGEGDDKYLPPFLSSADAGGIHSHGDGIMHIHPFFDATSGDNAIIEHFLTEMDVQITSEAITVQNIFDPSLSLVAGEECADGSGTASIKLLHWDFDFQALAEGRPDPEVIEVGIDQVKFEHDREVYVFAYIGEDTDLSEIPIPPQERFDALGQVSNAIEYTPNALLPSDSGVDITTDDDSGITITDEDGGVIDITGGDAEAEDE